MALVVKDIVKNFGEGLSETKVLKGINFEVEQGEFVILNGASGSGKTTLLTILGGLLSQTSGTVLYNDAPFAIMRAFMNNPKIILADEPTASLDADRATKVVEMIRQQIKEQQMIGIMITHDRRLFEYADRVIELEDGKITD
ncbi:TPA: ATP-binding cassette domain-containing protein [Staphylococcus aureus]|nr:ATP-binding cassette domain-containing protein [Staphylococcus aureus]